jgi:WD40 repeat protein
MLYLFSGNGELLWTHESGICTQLNFSPDEEYLAVGINLNNLHLFESATGKVLWNYKLEDARSFFSLAVSNNGEFVVAADGEGRRELPAGNSSTIFLFDKKGNIVWQKDLKIEKERAPNVRFTDDGKYLIICNSNKIFCYRISGGGR